MRSRKWHQTHFNAFCNSHHQPKTQPTLTMNALIVFAALLSVAAAVPAYGPALVSSYGYATAIPAPIAVAAPVYAKSYAVAAPAIYTKSYAAPAVLAAPAYAGLGYSGLGYAGYGKGLAIGGYGLASGLYGGVYGKGIY